MRKALFAVAAVAAVGVVVALLLLLDHPGSPDAPTGSAATQDGGLSSWHIQEALERGERQCSVCHYSPGPLWSLDWRQDPATREWELQVLPREPDVPLLAVAVAARSPLDAEGADAADPADPVVAATGVVVAPLADDGTWSVTLDVPASASALWARFNTERASTAVPLAFGLAVESGSSGPLDAPSDVWLEGPDGSQHPIPGPEADLHAGLLGRDQVVAGRWTLHAAVHGRPSGLVGVGSIEAYASAGAGPNSAATAAGPGAPATFRFPPADRPPEAVSLRVQPYHDHRPYEDSDWDGYDLQPHAAFLATAPGPAPPPAWATADPLAGWEEGQARPLTSFDLQLVGVYEDRPGHRNDGPLGTSKPYYRMLGAPVPPGTRVVRFEATWESADEQPDLDIRVKPTGTLRYTDAPAVLRTAGRAVFEWPVEPWQWDVPGGGHAEHGAWDVAPYLHPTGGPVQHDALAVHVQVTALQE